MIRRLSSAIFKWIPSTLNYTLLVGGAASLLDWSALVILVRAFHVSPLVANFPSLLVGSTVQFLGNRHFVFKATHRHAGKQAIEFSMVEFFAFLLNGSLFHLLVTWLHVNYAVARPVGSFIVFLFFSYPLWKFVFRKADIEPKPSK